MKLSNPTKILKGWGYELIYLNEDICIKRMKVLDGKKCSMHYHSKKIEVFYMESGTIELYTIDTSDGRLSPGRIYRQGDFIYIQKNTPHRFRAIGGDATFVEFSTHHEDSDSYRVEPGDSQLEKED